MAPPEEAAAAEGTASERLSEAVRSFVRWHAARHLTARVVQYELDSLGEEHRPEIVSLRRESDTTVARDHQRRCEGGEFDVPNVPGTTPAVLSLCIDVARWFNTEGRRTPDEVGALYADLVGRMVGPMPPEPRRAHR